MNELEEHFVSLHKELHTLAKQAAEVKKALISRYLTAYYPEIPYMLTIMDDNILAVDLVFPGLGDSRSRQIVDKVTDYLNGLHMQGN